jgi:hypothetical protein
MTYKTKERIAEILKSGDFVLEADGWGNYKPDYFLKAGFPKDFIEPLISTFKSDGTYKGSLWTDPNKGVLVWHELAREAKKLTDEQVSSNNWLDYVDHDVVRRFEEVYIPEQTGVYYLSFLYDLAKLFGVEKAGQGYIGRGFTASAYKEAIEKAVGLPIPA